MSGLRIQSMAFAKSGRLPVPVKSAQAVYAQYKHVYGRVARAGQKPLALTRIRNIDSYLANLQPKSFPSSSPFEFRKMHSQPVQQYRNIANASPRNTMGFGVNVDIKA